MYPVKKYPVNALEALHMRFMPIIEICISNGPHMQFLLEILSSLYKLSSESKGEVFCVLSYTETESFLDIPYAQIYQRLSDGETREIVKNCM